MMSENVSNLSRALKQPIGQSRNHREDRKYHKRDENKNTIYQDFLEEAKIVLMGIFIAVSVYIKKEERPQINNLTLYLKEFKK